MSQTTPQMESTNWLLCLAIMLLSLRIPSPYVQARFGCNLQVQQLKGNSVSNCLIVQISMIYLYLHLFLSPKIARSCVNFSSPSRIPYWDTQSRNSFSQRSFQFLKFIFIPIMYETWLFKICDEGISRKNNFTLKKVLISKHFLFSIYVLFLLSYSHLL